MTIAELIHKRADDTGTALLYEDRSWTWSEFTQNCSQRAAYLLNHRDSSPFHVGMLFDNIPEFPMWMGATALAGGVVVGLNSTRKGDDLLRDLKHTDCQYLIIEKKYWEELSGQDVGIAPEKIMVVDTDAYEEALKPYENSPLPDVEVKPEDIFMLIFTSGTSGAPKAVICSHGRIAYSASMVAQMQNLTEKDVSYVVMPLFHSNPMIVGWVPTIVTGGAMAMRRKFSASGFLPDIRKFKATFFNYVGKPLAYILATPEKPDDADNPLVRCYGNEGADQDIKEFARRFGCDIGDAYGSTEGGVSVVRVPGMPKGALGMAAEGVFVMNPVTEKECPRAQFDANGQLTNSNEAIGELVNKKASFEGYWKNDKAEKERTEGGVFRSGDLAYRDEQGFFYFAGRDIDWMRVDGENLAGSQIEQVILRLSEVELAAVYAVPDPMTGDSVMAALQLRPNADFNPMVFIEFLQSQSDFGTKWTPTYIRIAKALPTTATNKIIKRHLQQELWYTDDPVYWKKDRDTPYELMAKEDVIELEKEFERRGRSNVLKK